MGTGGKQDLNYKSDQTTMNLKTLLPIVFFTLSLQSCGQELGDTSYWQRIILSPDLKICTEVNKIDALILKRFQWDEMANPAEKFNATDVVWPNSGADRRLYFAAQLGRNWIVSYEQGGIGYREHCFFISIDDKERFIVYEGMRGSKSIEDLKSAVENNTFLIEYWAKGDH